MIYFSAIMHLVTAHEQMTPELEAQISAASAWAHITPTGPVKPTDSQNQRALITSTFTDLERKVTELALRLDEEERSRRQLAERLMEEERRRAEADLVLANHAAHTNNILRERRLLTGRLEQLESAHTLIQ